MIFLVKICVVFCLLKCSLQISDQKSAVVRYHVFTSNNQNKSFEIKYDQTKVDEKLLNLSSICNSSKSLYKFIVHGFAETWNMTYRWNWVKDFIDEMLRSQEASQLCIFAVDWKELARGGTVMANYWKAIDNMLIAADLMTNFFQINKINEKNMHCIGFSLGVHMCSIFYKTYFNKFNLKPGRITGLDPAGPFFGSKPSTEKLNYDDADFVDVIHTSDKFGLAQNLGDMDFYEDNGPSQIKVCANIKERFENLENFILYEENETSNTQKYDEIYLNQSQNDLEQLSVTSLLKTYWYKFLDKFFKKPKRFFLDMHQFLGCSHLMSVRFFLYSINKCTFKASYCNSLNDFQKNLCFIDNTNSFPRMGYYASKSNQSYKTSRANFFVNTTDKPPYCNDPINIQKSFL